MAKTKTNGVRKRKLVKISKKPLNNANSSRNCKRSKKKAKLDRSIRTPQKSHQQQKQQECNPPNYSDGKVSDFDSGDLHDILQAYSKDKLIEIISEGALKDSTLHRFIREAADRDISHRKIFVYGFGWDTTKETLESVFESFGEIEECKLIPDRNTGKAKGYGFVLFKTRKGALKALKNPKKQINNKIATCQWASTGPATQPQHAQDVACRKIYVSDVPLDVDAEKLKLFFAKFGEIESGPSGFDYRTGKSRGFALFVYKTTEGANKALEEPSKFFGGHQLHCQKAFEGGSKKQVQPVETQTQPLEQLQQPQIHAPVLAAMTAAQDCVLFGQNPAMNPVYNGVLGNYGTGFRADAGPTDQVLIPGTLNHGAIPAFQIGQFDAFLGGAVSAGAVGYSGMSNALVGIGAGTPSAIGACGSNLPFVQALQHVYPSPLFGQSSSTMNRGTGGANSGYPA